MGVVLPVVVLLEFGRGPGQQIYSLFGENKAGRLLIKTNLSKTRINKRGRTKLDLGANCANSSDAKEIPAEQ